MGTAHAASAISSLHHSLTHSQAHFHLSEVWVPWGYSCLMRETPLELQGDILQGAGAITACWQLQDGLGEEPPFA